MCAGPASAPASRAAASAPASAASRISSSTVPNKSGLKCFCQPKRPESVTHIIFCSIILSYYILCYMAPNIRCAYHPRPNLHIEVQIFGRREMDTHGGEKARCSLLPVRCQSWQRSFGSHAVLLYSSKSNCGQGQISKSAWALCARMSTLAGMMAGAGQVGGSGQARRQRLNRANGNNGQRQTTRPPAKAVGTSRRAAALEGPSSNLWRRNRHARQESLPACPAPPTALLYAAPPYTDTRGASDASAPEDGEDIGRVNASEHNSTLARGNPAVRPSSVCVGMPI